MNRKFARPRPARLAAWSSVPGPVSPNDQYDGRRRPLPRPFRIPCESPLGRRSHRRLLHHRAWTKPRIIGPFAVDLRIFWGDHESAPADAERHRRLPGLRPDQTCRGEAGDQLRAGRQPASAAPARPPRNLALQHFPPGATASTQLHEIGRFVVQPAPAGSHRICARGDSVACRKRPARATKRDCTRSLLTVALGCLPRKTIESRTIRQRKSPASRKSRRPVPGRKRPETVTPTSTGQRRGGTVNPCGRGQSTDSRCKLQETMPTELRWKCAGVKSAFRRISPVAAAFWRSSPFWTYSERSALAAGTRPSCPPSLPVAPRPNPPNPNPERASKVGSGLFLAVSPRQLAPLPGGERRSCVG